MTISILAYDAETGTYGGAATTGSLCVGGWVLRGDAESGLSASQGSLPSTLWGARVLDRMRAGLSAAEAVSEVVDADAGRAHRQLAALDPKGGTGHFTGASSIPAAGARQAASVVVTGNLLSGDDVLEACLDGYREGRGTMAERLIAALEAAAAAGGDSRGLLSAALLVVSRSAAPLSLRIDHSETPLRDLAELHRRATSGAYGEWARLVPTLDEPERAEPYGETVTPAG
ncbi:DUF1028 domain-containing protein [Limimaricola pyoseonensis]|uniref:Uncharacterized conserved protein, Ntn-hydrolase superfamily n=1 Tax=Limimaricola pyoseonensis TaxID=521013 RepID=A0A1G7AK44_9RHOB|nr:DUF1028 domain-containing protein [Limimaricola pyoseonensis]SDE15219.1 Uncharacterized conserved protein, Ntn-hydrolase superfamily [Limimaricola pyoseonensis]